MYNKNMKKYAIENKNKICKYDGCENPAHSRGYCQKHYAKLLREGFFDKELEEWRKRKCSIKGCKNPYYAGGYCKHHYRQNLRHGDPLYSRAEYHSKGDRWSSEYIVWSGIKSRCYNKKGTGYKYYGGRGIKMCDEWLHSFNTFLSDMGRKPKANSQIDRIDNDGNYEPSNCHWISPIDNVRKRRNVYLTMEIAREIREDFKRGLTRNELSKKYETSYDNIKDIISGKNWKEKEDLQPSVL